MSQAQRISHSSITKSDFDTNDDDLLRDLPSPFDEALNGRGRGQYLSPSMQTKSSSGLLDPDAFRRLSISTVSSRGISPYPPYVHSTKPWAWRTSIYNYWLRNECVISVVVSQAFGALMNVTTRLLELEGEGMHPFQILLARMGLTCLFCCAWMWWTKVPDFPLGAKGIRGLLVARGLAGFFGIYGMYYSLQYLPVADAVVITFLAPSFASYACYLFLKEPFPRSAQYASLVSLLGVVLIARPTSFFSSPQPVDTITTSGNETTTQATSSMNDFPTPTSAQRLSAVLVALLGVVGSAGAFTTIRHIGERAHPLISVNYFAVWCTLVSSFVLFFSKPLGLSDLTFALPSGLRQWTFLIFLGICGFLMQYLLTRGLGGKSGGRATNLIYTNMVFALALDWIIFNIKPGWWSAVGIGMILIPAIYIAKWTTDDEENKGGRISDEEAGVAMEERRGMLAGDGQLEGEREEEEVLVGTGAELEALSQPGIVETPAHIR